MTPTEMLREFHEAFGVFYADSPTLDIPAGLDALRGDLILEESNEVLDEISTANHRMMFAAGQSISGLDVLARIAKELADLVYVAYGTAITYGIDLDEVLKAVHESNMSKVGPNGEIDRRPDGKILKPPTYKAPDIQEVLAAQHKEHKK